VLAESEQQPLRDVLESDAFETPSRESQITLAIGPEGGWAEDELELFHVARWVSASLGSTILRAETAAVAATAIVISQLG
jgi:16S rRNA (uracil1498-N3)-methyltransferase